MLSALKHKSVHLCRQLGRIKWLHAAYRRMPGLQVINDSLRPAEPLSQVTPKPFFDQGMQYYWSLHTHATAEQEIDCLHHALACFEKALSQVEDAAETYLMIAKCLSFLGRARESDAAFAQYYACKRKQPAVAALEEQHRIFLPVSCVKVLGCTGYLATYVMAAELTGSPKKFIVLAPQGEASNESFLSYFSPYIERISDPAAIAEREPMRAAAELPIDWALEFQGQVNNVHWVTGRVTKAWQEQGKAPLLTLMPEHRERGREKLREHEIDPDQWFVCLHVRTAGFHKEAKEKETFRDADIETYRKAIRAIVAKDGIVFRMGDSTMPAFEEPGVIDYANSALKSDWMDVFLLAQCRFYIGTSSGVHKIPYAFGVPSVQTNAPAVSYLPFRVDDIVVPKLMRRIQDGRILTFAEMFAEPYGVANVQYLYSALGVEAINNSEDEILDAVRNMMASLQGGQRIVPPLTKLQVRFNQCIEAMNLPISGQLDAGFLQRHEALLEDA